MLLEPKVITAIADERERTNLVLLRSDEGGILNCLQLDIGEAEPGGYLALVQRVGEGVLRLLYRDHPAVFDRYPRLIPPTPGTDTVSIALALIERATQEKTVAYNAAIDALVASGELAGTNLPASWAVVWASLVERYGGN